MIPQIKKILYATDLTKNSSYAFYFATDLARKHDAKIVILHCIGSIPPSLYYEGGFSDRNRVLKQIRAQGNEGDIAEVKKRLQEFCQKVEVQIGPPASTSCPSSSSGRATPWKKSSTRRIRRGAT